MKSGNIILEVTQGPDVELGQLRWLTVKRIVEKHIGAARKELLRLAATERNMLVDPDLTESSLISAIHLNDREVEVYGKAKG